MAYYFLAASLPTLSQDEAPPITENEFIQTCEDNMQQNDYEDILHIMRGELEKAAHPFVKQWVCREILLRNALVRARAAKLDIEPDRYLKYCQFYEIYPDDAVSDIMRGNADSQTAKSTPLDREMALDRYRWDIIEEMVVFAPFSADAVMAFALKLKIALRWAGLEAKKGRAVVNGFIENAFEK